MKKGKKIAIALSVLLSAAPMVVPTVTPTISIAEEVTKNGVVDGELYDNGKLVTGEGVHTVKVNNTNKTYYTDKTGKVLYNWQTNTAGAKYYMGTDGLVRKGENKIGTAYYYFNTSGVMQTGPVTISGVKYLFANDGKKVLSQKFTTVKVKDVDKTYYTNASGAIQYLDGKTKKIGNDTYYFNTDGSIAKNTIKESQYFNANGKKVTGIKIFTIGSNKYILKDSKVLTGKGFKTAKIDSVEKTYYVNDAGVIQYINKGKVAVDGVYYFFTSDNGAILKDGIKNNNYYDKNGKMSTDTKIITTGGKSYVLNKGIIQTGKGVKTINSKYYYTDANGVIYKTAGVKTFDNVTYCFNADGTMKTSAWVTVNNAKYYFNAKGVAVNGNQKIGGKTHYFENYKLFNGYKTVNNVLYNYKDGIGTKVTGEYNKKYYKNGVLYSGNLTVNGTTYNYVKGVKQTGTKVATVTINNANSYYVLKDGKIITPEGFKTIKVNNVDKTYYTDKTGKILYKTTNNEGTFKRIGTVNPTTKLAPLYHFNKDGVLTKNAWRVKSDGYKYYFGNDGKAVKGKVKINNIEYSFDDTNKLQYTVKFINEGKVYNTQTVVYNKNTPFAAKTPANPTKVGYAFTGWDKKFNKITSNLTVNAKWKMKTVRVIFHKNDGGDDEKYSETYTYGVKNQKFGQKLNITEENFGSWKVRINLKNKKVKEYLLTGWTDAKTKKVYSRDSVVENSWINTKYNNKEYDVHLYAKWTPKTGWRKENGSMYYYKDGIKLTGWQYFGKGTGRDEKEDKHRVYFGNDGKLYTGWHYMGKAEGENTSYWAYFGSNGWLRTGWVKFGKGTSEPDGNSAVHWSYFGSNGRLRTGLQLMGNGTSNDFSENTTKHLSYFDEKGWLVTKNNTKVNGTNRTITGKGWLTTVYVDEFGGKGNDKSNDTQAMRDAVNSTETINTQITVLLKAGQKYYINPTTKLDNGNWNSPVLINRNNITIKSNSSSKAKIIVPGGEHVNQYAHFQVHVGQKNISGKKVDVGKNVKFEGLSFEGTIPVTKGLEMSEMSNYNGRCIQFESWSSDAVKNYDASGSTVNNCNFYRTGKRAIGIHSDGNSIPGSKNNTHRHGLTALKSVKSVQNIKISGCTFTENKGIAICTAGADKAQILNNTFTNSGLEHITLDWGSKNCLVRGNNFGGVAGGCGVIGMDTARNNTISNNIFNTTHANNITHNDMNGKSSGTKNEGNSFKKGSKSIFQGNFTPYTKEEIIKFGAKYGIKN